VTAMPAYYIAQIQIHDWDEYRQYLAGTDGPLAQFEAEVLVVDDQPALLEGEWDYTRTVVIRFPDVETARNWYNSPQYREIVRRRHNAARTNAVIVQGRL